MHEPQKSLPLQLAPFSMDECKGLASVLSGYSQFLQRTPLFPARETQAEWDKRIKLLKSIVQRLDRQLAGNPTEIQLPLNAEEVEEVVKALIGFVIYIQQVVPPSRGRDETLAAVDGWRLRLVGCVLTYPGIN
jgi:hypothetical protein